MKPQAVSVEQFHALLKGETTVEEIQQKRIERQMRRAQAKLQQQFEDFYRNRSTPYLLEAMRRNRLDRMRDMEWEHLSLTAKQESDARWWAVKKILSTRPHHLKAPERHALRKARALANRGLGKSKDR
ncbi:MAG: hypothetical protein EOP83_04425 [Verrucomicrobiaceae bacterium]|nr:MAG: hypothetical protein EOP83_04425 [Verrucomicrobiaceae bacterium]